MCGFLEIENIPPNMCIAEFAIADRWHRWCKHVSLAVKYNYNFNCNLAPLIAFKVRAGAMQVGCSKDCPTVIKE